MKHCIAVLLALSAVFARGEGMRLDRNGPVYEAPPQKSLDLTDEVTLEAWIQPEPMSGGCRILDKSTQGGQDGYNLDTFPGNGLRLITDRGSVTAKVALPVGRWCHVAATYSASRKFAKLYLDGKEVASVTDGRFPPLKISPHPLRVGCDSEGGNRFVGRIRQASVYDVALPQNLIARHALGSDARAADGVVAVWTFEEKPGEKIAPVAGGVALQRSSGTKAGGAGPAAATAPADQGVKFTGASQAPAEPLSLWYRKPAGAWVEALAVGNGRLGAMIFGGVNQERLQLNEDTLWAGGPYDPTHGDALPALPEARRLIFEGKYGEASRLVGDKMMARPLGQMPYQPVGDLLLDFPEAKEVDGYRRDLNLDTAVGGVSYVRDGVSFTREVFASPVDQVIVVRLAAGAPGALSFSAGLRTPQKATVGVEGDTLVMNGVNGAAQGIEGKLKFQCRVRVQAKGGKTDRTEDRIVVTGADEAVLLVAAATSHRKYDDVGGDPDALAKHQIALAAKKPFGELRTAHVAEHQRLFRRVSLELGDGRSGGNPAPDLQGGTARTADTPVRDPQIAVRAIDPQTGVPALPSNLPTDERIRQVGKGPDDPALAALYFQFARYLLISCSRPGTQPANLQGLWNESMNPPWGSKYTININTEMNYWPAEPANLAECVEPLIAMVMDLAESGRKTAREHWGAGGWVTHHNTDLWRATAPIDGPAWGFWPSGGAWLCQHLWEHYLFGGDKAFLARAYPALKGAAQFFLDTLVEEPGHQWLVTCPSMSPENRHPKGAAVCAGPTMDMQIIRDLFANTIAVAEILAVDPDFRKQVAAARARLAPNRIGKAGQLQEWLDDWDVEAPEQRHRHVSHLYGLFPSAQISARKTPELAAAARKSLETRGDKATGWAIAWRINLWARLLEGDHAHDVLKLLLDASRTYPNMFDAHPPFQIDGNFGGASGMIEMLLQSHEENAEWGMRNGEKAGSGFPIHHSPFIIDILPALPKAWASGSVKGLRARGGFTVDIAWKDGKVSSYRIGSAEPREVQVRIGGEVKTVRSEKNGTEPGAAPTR